MLHTETIEPRTLSLLKELMGLPFLDQFSLVGGTVLALKYGHRHSIDLDLFSHQKFVQAEIIALLENIFKKRFVYEHQPASFGIFGFIDDVKIDIMYYPHQLISSIETIEKVRMYSNADIAAMKIQAILGRGQKKDFWDLYELLQHYSLQQIIDWHKKKYPSQMLAISIPNALSYFVDAEESETPLGLKNQNWDSIKRGIQNSVRNYLR